MNDTLPLLPEPIWGYSNNTPKFSADQMRAYVSAALAQQPASVEPVAHVSECEACFTPDACQLRGTCDHYAAEKLRIAAAPHPAPARVPLTDEQIMDIVDKERARVLMNEARVAYRVARAIEAAHGIVDKE